MAEEGDTTTRENVDGSFSDRPKGDPVKRCPTWIELRFEPKPPQPRPNPEGPSAGEETFAPKYRYELRGGGAVLKSGVLDLRNGSVIRHDDVPCGSCSFVIDFPSFKTEQGTSGTTVVWRKQWPQLHEVKTVEFHGLETEKVHYFDIVNELALAAAYMATEMKTNAVSDTTKGMRSQNDAAARGEQYIQDLANAPWWQRAFAGDTANSMAIASTAQRGTALGTWGWNVREGGPWDHKGHFRNQAIGGRTLGAWHTWGEWEYFFDVWSNIHYGYVGRASGFSRQTLFDGADLEQRAQNFIGGRQSGADPAQDKLAIGIGADLYEQNVPITPELLIQKIESNPAFDRRPHSHNSANGAQAAPSIKKR